MSLTEPDIAGGWVEQLQDVLLPTFDAEQDRLDYIDNWARWHHDAPHIPRTSTREYQELSGRSQTPWLSLIVKEVVQALYAEDYRTGTGESAGPWRYWQANGMDRRQTAIYEGAVKYGTSYVKVLPGVDLSGDPMPTIRGASPRRLMAFFPVDDLDGDFPAVAIEVMGERGEEADRTIKVYDSLAVHRYADKGGKLTPLGSRKHGAGVVPVVRYALLDSDARSAGEVEPYISVAARIDQTTFDRLVTQRFSSWVVRTVTGMAEPETDEEARVAAIRLRQEDILVAESPDAKFGSLPSTPLDGFITSKDADIRDLAAVSQTPPHHLLGQVSNLSAEALAAAEAALSRKNEVYKHSFGESNEQMLRLAAHIDGDTEAALDVESQIRWRDVESRSLAQTADALGKLAQMLGVPPEALWERIPGVTQQDVEAWKAMAEESDMNLLIQEIRSGFTSPGVPGAQPSQGRDTGTGL